MYKKGILTVKPVCAKITEDTEAFGKMDCYCIVKLNNQKHKTKVSSNTG